MSTKSNQEFKFFVEIKSIVWLKYMVSVYDLNELSALNQLTKNKLLLEKGVLKIDKTIKRINKIESDDSYFIQPTEEKSTIQIYNERDFFIWCNKLKK